MMEERFKPTVTADILVWRQRHDISREVLVITRNTEPYKGCFALTGGHFESKDNSVVHAAKRELEEVKLEAPLESFQFVNTYDEPNRDPRGRAISFLYAIEYKPEMGFAEPDDGTDEILWLPLVNLKMCVFAFDHRKMIDDWYDWQCKKEINEQRIKNWLSVNEIINREHRR